jgi:hypothetical protein
MGRRPEGDQALTGAERQARYRLRLGAAPAPRDRQTAKSRKLTRPQRWYAAVGELLALQAEYANWLEALPEATRDSATGEALQAIVDLDLDEIAAIQPPRGFGRD